MQKEILIIFFATIRVSSMMVSSPVFSLRQIPSLFKFGLSVLIGFIISSVISLNGVILPVNTLDFLCVVFKEVTVGLSIGFAASLIFNAIRVSAQLMDFQAGFSMSQYYDPATSGNSTPIERLLNWFAIVIFLTFNFHHVLISAVIKSFEVVPAGIYHINPMAFSAVIDIFIKGFYIAIQLAAPIVIVLFITDFTIGLISRSVPQINVFVLGMPVKVLVALMALSVILPGLTRIYVKSFEGMTNDIMNLFKTLPFLMLMASDDKTEEPTSKKIDDARKKGQVPKSVDLNSAMILLGVTIFFIINGSKLYNGGRQFIIDSFKFITKNDIGIPEITSIFIYMLKNILIATLPILLTVMCIGIASNIAQSGFLLVEDALRPKFERINPIEGFKRLFSKRAFVELIKSILKITLISYVAISFVKGQVFNILKTSDLNPKGIYPFVKKIIDSQLLRLAMVVIAIGLADYIFQRRQYKRDLRMTKQEIKEEYKQSEGDPQIKSRIRQKQKEMAMRRMMHEVPKATVVVTNPTHFAVALKYEKGNNSAPKVIAKGADLIAFRIKEIAKENNVPIVENKPLARTLYSRVEINEDIPVELYQAVAEIIAYVYSLKKM